MPAGLRPVASLNLIPSIALVPKTICTLAVQRARRSTKKRRGEIMVTFVLVHGAWHGAWPGAGCSRRVAQPISGRGDEVCPPTLAGVADRSPLGGGNIDLDTQIL